MLVFFDLETGGLNPKTDAVTQIAAVAVDEDLQELESFEAKVIFGTLEGKRAALNRRKYDPEVWAREGRRADEVAWAFRRFLERHASIERMTRRGPPLRLAQAAGHNAGEFDWPFLQEWYRRQGIFCPIAHNVLCTLQRAQWWFLEHPDVTPPENLKLGTLCEYFGIPLGDDAHDALADVRATVSLYRLLCAPVRLAA